MHGAALVLNLTMGLLAALVLGYITHRLGLSTILGYLLAGIAIGPHTPGFVGDPQIAAQLADIGVILLMFGVGSHLNLKSLLAVKAIAIPGAIAQSVAATALGALVAHWFGWGWGPGLVLGAAISVASTVVLVRVLMDNGVLNTVQGHVAVGWLLVEDIFTVLLLVVLPVIADAVQGGSSGASVVGTLGWAFLKLAALAALMLFVGARLVPWLMLGVAKTRSAELFTLTVLVAALAIAMGSALLFGASIALGAFLAGLVVAQSEVSHQAAAEVLPMRDAFAVLFFVSVGMLFDPMLVIRQPMLVLAVLLVILLAKPLAALLIVALLGYSSITALTVAVGLAQIGEFSFILAELGRSVKFLPDEAHSVLVACALVSIALNPVLFKLVGPVEAWLQRRPLPWRRGGAGAAPVSPESRLRSLLMAPPQTGRQRAVVVGYGPVGQTVTRILSQFGITAVVVDLNVDTVARLKQTGTAALYGDATRREVLKAAGVPGAQFLVVALPDLASRIPVVAAARALNPDIRILVRAHYVAERAMLEEVGASAICCEEAEAAVALAGLVLREMGATEEFVRQEADKIRDGLKLKPETKL